MDILGLRLGNLVYDDRGVLTTVYSLSKTEINNDSLSYKYSLIPLTEQWLIRLGLKLDRYGNNTYGLADFCIAIKEDGLFTLQNDPNSDAQCHYVCDIEYVNQLQNIFYDIAKQKLLI